MVVLAKSYKPPDSPEASDPPKKPTLAELLKRHLPKERRDQCEFAELFIGLLIKFRTVNLSKLAPNLEGSALLDSRYDRICRLIKNFDITPEKIMPMILGFFPFKELTLIIDRTNWKIGATDVNFLMIAMRYNGTAIPLIFDLLDHCGNSAQDGRIDLLEKLIANLPEGYTIKMMLGDREFIGEKWIARLAELGIQFCLRIKSDAIVTEKDTEELPNSVAVHAQGLKKSGDIITIPSCAIYGNDGQLQLTKSEKGDIVAVFASTEIENPLEEYRNRWGIEHMFQSFKSHGFDFEDTHLRDHNRLTHLTCFMTIAYCTAVCVGESCDGSNDKNKNDRLKQSIFRRGLDALQSFMRNGIGVIRQMARFLCVERFCYKPLRV